MKNGTNLCVIDEIEYACIGNNFDMLKDMIENNVVIRTNDHFNLAFFST